MRLATALVMLLLAAVAFAQDAAKSASQPKSVMVPMTIDHNRIVINVTLPFPDGSLERIRAWVDNGNPDLYMSRRAAGLMGLKVVCDDKACSAPPPPEVMIGDMKISLATVKEVKIPLKPIAAAAVMAPGMSAEINIPSSVLRNYDVLIDFPGRQFTIAQPGSLAFKGVSGKVAVNPESGLIQVPSQVENKKYSLALDLGASVSFLSEELFDKLATAHPDWPHMTGAVGPANMWGLPDEPNWKLMRLDRLQYGPLHLTGVPFVKFNAEALAIPGKRGALPTAGLLGSQALLNYRVGLDYAHATVFFDIGRLSNFPDFDIVGLILRPEDDGRFTILGVADYEGKPSLPQGLNGVQAGDHLVAVDGNPVANFTLGLVWSLLLGGQEHKLTLERGGKEFTVAANVHHFLDDESGGDGSTGKTKKNEKH
ncbi:MAG: hypothetical protein WB562_12725 [Candidatus Sulfotelmatobacter sp.]